MTESKPSKFAPPPSTAPLPEVSVSFEVEWFSEADGYEVVHRRQYGSATAARDAWQAAMKVPHTYGHDLRRAELRPGCRWVTDSILTEDEAADAAARLIEVRQELTRAIHAPSFISPAPADEGRTEAPPRDPGAAGGRLERDSDPDLRRGRRGRGDGLEPDFVEEPF